MKIAANTLKEAIEKLLDPNQFNQISTFTKTSTT